jgi:LPS export ABC transporter protein LptC
MGGHLTVKKYARRALLAGLVVTVVTTTFWFRHQQGRKEEGPPIPPTPFVESKAQMITRDFRHVETRMNRTAWIVEASVAEIFQNKARLMRVKVTYFGDGEEATIITGRQALVDLESWDAELVGDVRAVGHDGTVMKTRKLEWNNRDQTLLAPWPVRIRSPYGQIEGRKLLANVDKKWVRIFGRVATEFTPPPGFAGPAG